MLLKMFFKILASICYLSDVVFQSEHLVLFPEENINANIL
jgi:hypothetical protein